MCIRDRVKGEERRPPRSTLDRSSAASDVYKRQRICVFMYLFIFFLISFYFILLCSIMCTLEDRSMLILGLVLTVSNAVFMMILGKIL